MNKTKLAKAIGFAIAGVAFTAGSVSTASASSTTSYNLFHANPNGLAMLPVLLAQPVQPMAGSGVMAMVCLSAHATSKPELTTIDQHIGFCLGGYRLPPNKTPFGYKGGGTLNWGLEFTGAGAADTRTISNADSIATYGVSADIDSARGAWSDNISTNVGVAGGWRHDLDFGLFKSATTGLVTLKGFSRWRPRRSGS